MEKTIEVGTIKAGFAQGGYFNAKVVYKGEDISEQPVREVTTVVTKIDDTLPTGEYLVVRYGQDNIFRSTDEWFFIFQEERPEEQQPVKTSKIEAGAVIGGVQVLSVGDIYTQESGSGIKNVIGLNFKVICLDGKKRLVQVQSHEENKVTAGSYMMNGDFTHGASRYIKLDNKKIFGKDFASAVESAVLEAVKNGK